MVHLLPTVENGGISVPSGIDVLLGIIHPPKSVRLND